MKRLILFSAFFTVASACFAQTECAKSNPIFKSEKTETPKEVYTLGSNPEFPFLRNLSTPQQVASAIKRGTNKHGMAELDRMLRDIGFANGAKDVDAAAISAYNVPVGTLGNMGDGKFNTVYVKLMGSDEVRSWKITAATGCYLYVLAKCGNAFYPAEPVVAAVAIKDMPVNIAAEKESTLEGNKPKTTTECDCDCDYYYRCHRHHYDRCRRWHRSCRKW